MINPNRTRRSDLEKNRDYLTNAHNRNHMIDKLNELIGKNSWFHLYCVDVDSFRKANRLKGFQRGDALLINLFHSLCDLCPESVIFRSHGDQFFMIVEDSGMIIPLTKNCFVSASGSCAHLPAISNPVI